MDLSLLYTDDQTQASLTDSQTGDSDSLSFLLNPIENMLPSAYETATEADESSEIVTNISKYQEACLEKHTDSAQLNLSTSTYNTSECLSRCSELLSKDDDLRVDECFDSSEPILHPLPHLSEDLVLNSSKAKEFYIKKEPSLSLSLIDDDDTPEPLGAMSCFPKSLMEISTTEPLLSEFGFSSEHSEAAYTLRSLSPRSNSLDSDTAIAPVPDLYIFESETQDFILNPNIDPQEITCPEYQPLSQTEGKNTRCDSDQHFLMCDSGDVLTKCHHSSPEGQATVDYESDVSQHTWLTPPASDACEANSMSVNDARREAAEVTDFTLQASQSDSPVELWLDACQYLATEDTDDKDVLDKTSYTVMQGGLLTTGDLSFFPGETQGSGYNPEGSEGIGWSSEDVIGLGPRVERWSSVDSWATALSDWTGIVTASPEDITPVFTEIGAEIDALTRALAEVNTSSKEGQSQDTMGVQDQQFPESSVASGQSCFSVGPEFQDRDGSICDSALVTQRHKDPENSYTHSNLLNSSMGSTSATAAFSRGNSVNTLTLIPKSTSSADRDISEFGDGFLETDIFISNEDPILLNITEDTDDLEGQNVPADLIIKEPPGHGLCEVTDEHIIFQSSSVVEQEDKRCCGPVKIDGEETKPSADLHFPTTHTLTNSHVPGEDTQPDLNAHDYIHVSPDTLPDLDRACQVEPQWGSPKFIMPLAPLSIASSLICRTSSSLEGDQIYAKRSFNDKTDLCCDQVQPCAVWPTLDGITDKPSQEGDKDLFPENKNTIDSAECFFTERKTITEEFNDLSRELSYFTAFPADNFFISRKDRVAIITLDLNDPFAPRVEKSSITAAEMPHKTRSKKDKSASHHHVAQVSKKQENLSNHVSAEENRKQQEIHPLSGENHNNEITPAELEKVQAKLGIDTSVVEEKSSNKSHGKKKKKHGQNATTLKSVTEPLAELENGAKPKTAKGRIDMFEAKQGAKAEKSQKDNDQIHDGEKKSQQLTAKASQGERAENHVEHKESKKFTGPLNDDAIKRRRLSEDKFGKIVSALESKLPKPDVSIKVKAEEPKTDAEATRKKAYSEVVKQKAPSKADPTVVQPIQAVSVSGDPQSLCLWCQFAAVFSDYTVTWSREGTTLAEIKRSAGDESRVSVTISNASHKDLGKYQCRLSSLHGSVTLDYLLTYEVLSEIVIPQTPKTVSSAPVEVGSEEEDVHCSKLIFKEDFLTDQCFGDNHSVSIVTEKVHFGEGMHRRAFRTKLQTGQMSRLQPGHSCVLKVHNSLSYGTNNSDELVQKNFNLAVEECQVQNTARQYIKAYTAEAQSFEDFGDVPEIIPIYLVHRPSNDIPYATLEEELIGDFVKYSVKDGKEINLLRRDSEAGQKCCAFQHWVYHNTEGNLLVTDMQGVGMRLTDVGIATCKKGYKGFKGNCATSFIDQFKALHQCNMYCDILGLKSLQPKPKKSSAPKPKPQPAAAAPKKKTFGPTVKGKS